MTRQDSSTEVSLDTVFELLANEYRRRLLVALVERDTQNDEALQIPTDIAHEYDGPDSSRIARTHCHLPKLEEVGFIEWDRDDDSVRKGPRFDEIRPLLELMQNHSDELTAHWL